MGQAQLSSTPRVNSIPQVLLIKQWDSDGGLARGRSDVAERRATFSLHSAFADPRTPPGGRDRESIEAHTRGLNARPAEVPPRGSP